jgi:mono/diheme cytochrome c family protein
MMRLITALTATATLASLFGIAAAQAPAATQGLVGNAQRGKTFFSDTYNCYACHGFDAQTGERRLVPMRFTQEGFITFVQNSPLPQMPVFADVPAQNLADIYAYIRSIPVDAPALADIPVLRDIAARKDRAAAQ